MTTQSAIRYRFLVVWLEHSVNPKGHLSWSSGLTAFYFHGATLFSPREQQHDTIRVFSNDAFIALVLTNKTNSGISYPGEKGKEHWKEDFFLVMEYWVRDLTSASPDGPWQDASVSAERADRYHKQGTHNHLWKVVVIRRDAWGLEESEYHPSLPK